MFDENTLSLAQEYLDLIASMRSGGYTTDEIHQLDSQRQWTHNELIRLTGLHPSDDMAAYCRRILHLARGSGR
jgi:hypothetical protein